MDYAYKAKTAFGGKYLGNIKCRITYGKVSARKDQTPSTSSPQDIHESGFGQELDFLPQPVFHSIEQRGNKNNNKSSSGQHRANKQYITPEHNEMIKYVQQSWKGVERDYKKSVNKFINTIDLKQTNNVKNKTVTTSTPLLMPGSYHHSSNTKDSFQPFDLETFWGNRILKSLTEEK